PITPESLGKVSAEDLQACGMTMRKANYIKDMTDSILKGDIDLSKLDDMDDEEVCKYLCQIKGIGIWTAQMVMTFSMQRPDVISFGDLAILRGLRMLYGHKEITREIFNKYEKLYSPYASVASLYIWEIAGGALPHLKDPANN
ncbi:MAG: DNA-3-methyladenine glycosylase 2 family protein, partial [Clostridiales bacterium]|nr:DNA-3-methyladenine glycosylase 2 family protein [Clostridiales bacterium]